MKNKCNYYYDNVWTVLKFPKRNRAILYNGTTKQYDFYSLPADLSDEKVLKNIKTVKYPTKMLLFLAGALGISLAINIINTIF